MSVENRDSQFVLVQDFFIGVGRGLAASQQLLDERGRRSLLAWEQEGLPPTVFTWAECRLSFPVALRFLPRTATTITTGIAVAPRDQSLGKVTLALHYIPNPQDGEKV